jgi:DHA1 family tetracycline resistance protein-like MFS transporter
MLRAAAASYFLVTLARNSLDAQFVNYASVRFGWSQQQTGPVMVLVGLMLAIVPRLMVPLLGLRLSLLSGLLVFASGLVVTALAPTPFGFVVGIAIVAFGCVSLPALQAFLASLAPVGERGALLGALGSLTELTSAIGSTMYARLLAHFSSPAASLQVPGMHFLVAAALLLVAFGLNVFSASSA